GRGRSRADAHPPGFAGLFATTVLTSGRLVRSAAAQASSLQAWPTRHVRLIVPFVPGGAADVIARVLGNRLSEAWGQQVVVENAAGPAPISAPRSQPHPIPTATRSTSPRCPTRPVAFSILRSATIRSPISRRSR